MHKIYIVLSYTGSFPAKIIKHTTGKTYTHVSISLDKELKQMYSFGRKYLRCPIPGGFIKERIDKGLFMNDNVLILIKEISINESQYKKILDVIYSFDYNPSHYDYKGAIGIYFNRNMFEKNGYVCSSFVNELLNCINVDTSKYNWEIHPEDFRYLSNTNLIYEGFAIDYLKKE